MAKLQNCRKCKRLRDNLRQIKKQFPSYHCLPVSPIGNNNAQILIVGLAPGKHGANASGIPFSGDDSGVFLFNTLTRFGLAETDADQKLSLLNCRITNAVKCFPPDNKPNAEEINQCNRFLKEEINQTEVRVIIALGAIAHKAILKALDKKIRDYPFGHLNRFQIDNKYLIDSYHCSKYNTQTKRLTQPMFDDVFNEVQIYLDEFTREL